MDFSRAAAFNPPLTDIRFRPGGKKKFSLQPPGAISFIMMNHSTSRNRSVGYRALLLGLFILLYPGCLVFSEKQKIEPQKEKNGGVASNTVTEKGEHGGEKSGENTAEKTIEKTIEKTEGKSEVEKGETSRTTTEEKSTEKFPDLPAYVAARGGLNLRSQPHRGSEILYVLTYRTRVLIREKMPETELIGKQSGRWTRIRIGEGEGWVFDAFLSDSLDKLVEIPGDFATLYRSYEIESRLLIEDKGSHQVIGRLSKKPGDSRYHIETIHRTCGGGRGDKKPLLKKDELSFRLYLHWCSVDPGDLVRIRCINCELQRYQCRLPRKELEEAYREPHPRYRGRILCSLEEKSFCAEECLERR